MHSFGATCTLWCLLVGGEMVTYGEVFRLCYHWKYFNVRLWARGWRRRAQERHDRHRRHGTQHGAGLLVTVQKNVS
jgi:hypothetical protein